MLKSKTFKHLVQGIFDSIISINKSLQVSKYINQKAKNANKYFWITFPKNITVLPRSDEGENIELEQMSNTESISCWYAWNGIEIVPYQETT